MKFYKRADGYFPRVPFHRFGPTVTTDNLYEPQELEIFRLYEHAKKRYSRALDIGACVGSHSLLMARQGWQVRAYEPDPETFVLLCNNLHADPATEQRVTAHKQAVSDRSGEAQFVRRIDNRTGSHLSGLKPSNDRIEAFTVRTLDARDVFRGANFSKIDAEGSEVLILERLLEADFVRCDMVVEVGSPENAIAVWNRLWLLEVPCYAQKDGWAQVRNAGAMPTSWRDGHLFISVKGGPFR